MSFLAFAIPTAFAAALYTIIDKGAGLYDFAHKLDYTYKITSYKINLANQTIDLIIDFTIINPTDNKLSLSYPLVMLYINDKGKEEFISQNVVIQQQYEIPSYGQLTIPNLQFQIPFSTFFTIAQNILNVDIWSYIKGGRISEAYQKIANAINEVRKKLIYYAYFRVNGFEIKVRDTLEGLGYSPISAIDRPIKDGSIYDKYFKLPENKKEILRNEAIPEDTVQLMHKIVKKDAHLIKNFSELFRSSSIEQTAKKIFNWTYDHLKYNIERGEQIKNPLVSYHLGQRLAREFYKKYGYYNPEYSVDCDDLAVFIASILYNLGIPYSFRLAAYNPNRGYQHVYVVVSENGKEIILDPVYYRFNAEKKPVKKLDIPAPLQGYNGQLANVPVEYLYGVEPDTSQRIDNIVKNIIRLQKEIIKIEKPKGYKELLSLYNYLLNYWDTEHRIKALEIVADYEQKLCNKNIIKQHNLFRKLQHQTLTGWFDNWKDVALSIFAPPVYLVKKGVDYLKKHKASNKTQKNNNNQPTVPVVPQNDTLPQIKNRKIKKYLIIGGSVLLISGGVSYYLYKKTKNIKK